MMIRYAGRRLFAGDVRLIQRAMVRREDRQEMTRFDPDLVMGKQRAADLTVGDINFGQESEAFADKDRGRQLRIGDGGPIVRVAELRTGQDVALMAALEIFAVDRRRVSERRVQDPFGGQPQSARDDQVA